MINRIFIYCLIFFAGLSITSCGNNKEEETEVLDTSSLSKEELFASVMVGDFLKEDDDDLQEYFQVEIYPIVSNAERIFIEKISTSEYMVTFSEANSDKRIIIHKYFDLLNDQVFFEKSEVISEADLEADS